MFTTCTGDEKPDQNQAGTAGGRPGGVFRIGMVEPTAIDPYNAHESEGLLVTRQLFVGLVRVKDETAELTPGVAETWSKDEGCTEWTFKLRSGTTFSNGDPVNAEAFIRGMTRAAKQKAASEVAHHMAGIEGYEAIHGRVGENAPPATVQTFSGLSAPDSDTLKVKLSAPDCEFDKKTLQPVYSPVPASAGEADNKPYNDMPIGNGPFKMKEPWRHDRSITLVRSDSYFDTRAHLDEVAITLLRSTGALEAEYKGARSGQFDFARIPPTLIPQARAEFDPKGGFIHELTNGINYLLVNVVNPPLNRVDARKAISLAIDRDAIIANVFKGLQTKASSIVPPQFKAYYQADVCDVCDKPDVAKAKELAARAGLTPGTEVNLGFDSGGGHEAWVQAIAQQLRDNLGLKVELQSLPFLELRKTEAEKDADGLFQAAWIADYPSAENFLFPLLSKNSGPAFNRGGYRNTEFDNLLAQGRKTVDDGERARLLRQAERLAIGDDLALIPLWYRSQYRVYDSNKWQNVALDFLEHPTLATLSLR
jgi:ABC-type oligopeptide transport system substrate-binding subunit